MQQFSPWIAGFPGLIWSIDIPHSRLKVFNRWSIPGLDVPRLLKDARYRKKAVRREDHALLMDFFRKRDADGAAHAMAIHMHHSIDVMGLEA